jgi:hypothetical protein
VIDISVHGFTVRVPDRLFLIVIAGILGTVIASSVTSRLTPVMGALSPGGFTKNDCTRSERRSDMMNILRSFVLSMGDLGYGGSIFFYSIIEKCNIFLEFCNLVLIFVVEDDSFLGYEDDIEIEFFERSEREIIESPPEEVAIDTPSCMFSWEDKCASPMGWFGWHNIRNEHIRKERFSLR